MSNKTKEELDFPKIIDRSNFDVYHDFDVIIDPNSKERAAVSSLSRAWVVDFLKPNKTVIESYHKGQIFKYLGLLYMVISMKDFYCFDAKKYKFCLKCSTRVNRILLKTMSVKTHDIYYFHL